MRRDLVPVYNSFANYEICYANQFHADLEGFNIRSTGFTIDGISETVYLTDLPNSDQKTGVVKYFTFDNGIVKYINENAGKVDYVKGEIILYPVSISSSVINQKIEIEVTPESNDILAKENLYIIIDITGKSILRLKEDLISSGSNRSGSNYTPPSSFISNKKYTR